MTKPNYKLLAEVDDILERAKKIRDEIEKLCLKDPAVECWNCGCNKWLSNGHCFNCKEHWRGKP